MEYLSKYIPDTNEYLDHIKSSLDHSDIDWLDGTIKVSDGKTEIRCVDGMKLFYLIFKAPITPIQFTYIKDDLIEIIIDEMKSKTEESKKPKEKLSDFNKALKKMVETKKEKNTDS